MKLSFVIPAYNEEAYIGKCLSSVLNCAKNGAYDVEIIVVNNASTDRTKQIAQSFEGVRVIDEPERGLSRARQTGYLSSTGDLIANVDADTILGADWISKVFEEFSVDNKLIALSGPFIYYDLSKTMRFYVRLFYYIGFVSYILNRHVFRVASMLQGGNFIVKRSALDKINGYNLEYGFGEDADMARRLHKVGKTKFTFNLPMYASGRRLAKEGALTMSLRYGLQYFWTVIFKRPFTQNFPDIRSRGNKKGELEYKPNDKKKEWLIAVSYAVVLISFFGALYFSSRTIYRSLASAFTVSEIKAATKRLEAKLTTILQD